MTLQLQNAHPRETVIQGSEFSIQDSLSAPGRIVTLA
jgi:hypothetical protein